MAVWPMVSARFRAMVSMESARFRAMLPMVWTRFRAMATAVLMAAMAIGPMARGAGYAAPQFGGETMLPSLRLALPELRGSAPVPAKPVVTRRYRWTRGTESWEDARSPAVDLWRAAQTGGTWRDRAGNELTIARAAASLPAFEHEDATAEEFRRAMESGAFALGADATPEALADWAAFYAGVEASGAPAPLPVNRSRFAAAWEIPLADPAMRAYLFRFDAAHAGQGGAQNAWFAALFRFGEMPPDRAAADRLLRSGLLAQIHATGRFAAGARDPKARPRARPDAEVPEDAQRARARASIELLDAWWHMDSTHYILLSDVPGGTAPADRLLGTLEALRPRYAALVPRLSGREDPTSVVRLFRSDDEFRRYFEGTPLELTVAETAGWYDGGRRELVIRPSSRKAGVDPDATVRHEGFHQWLASAWGGAEAPMWFNEGTAEFFECYEPRGAGASFEFRERRGESELLERLARSRDADWTGLLRATLLADARTFYRPPHFGGNAQGSYAFAYGLMYFLYRGAPAMRGQPWKDVLPDFFAAMDRTGDPVAATLAAFRMGSDGRRTDTLEKFADDLRAFWRTESARRDARSARIP